MTSPWDERFPTVVRGVLTGVDEIDPETPLRDGGLNSLGSVQLIMALEHAYAVDFPDELLRLEAFETAGTLWDALSTLL